MKSIHILEQWSKIQQYELIHGHQSMTVWMLTVCRLPPSSDWHICMRLWNQRLYTVISSQATSLWMHNGMRRSLILALQNFLARARVMLPPVSWERLGKCLLNTAKHAFVHNLLNWLVCLQYVPSYPSQFLHLSTFYLWETMFWVQVCSTWVCQHWPPQWAKWCV